MRKSSKRIEVEFPQAPAPSTLIAVTNHGVTALGYAREGSKDVIVRHPTLPFVDEPHERRWIIESALHD
jgi:hypothetical protein